MNRNTLLVLCSMLTIGTHSFASLYGLTDTTKELVTRIESDQLKGSLIGEYLKTQEEAKEFKGGLIGYFKTDDKDAHWRLDKCWISSPLATEEAREFNGGLSETDAKTRAVYMVGSAVILGVLYCLLKGSRHEASHDDLILLHGA